MTLASTTPLCGIELYDRFKQKASRTWLFQSITASLEFRLQGRRHVFRHHRQSLHLRDGQVQHGRDDVIVRSRDRRRRSDHERHDYRSSDVNVAYSTAAVTAVDNDYDDDDDDANIRSSL